MRGYLRDPEGERTLQSKSQVIAQKLEMLHINLLCVIGKIKGLDIPGVGISNPFEFCQAMAELA